MRRGSFVRVAFAMAAAGALACARNPYVIGSVCPPAGADGGADPRCVTAPSNATLAVTFDSSGASTLGALSLAGGATLAPSLWLRGERATASAWPAESGPSLVAGASAAAIGQPAPFTDGTTAVRFAADAPSYVAADPSVGAVAADDFALEVVLRAANGSTLLDKHAGGVGWWLHEDPAGQLLLDLGDGDPTHAVSVAYGPLTPGAWYHCMYWVSHASAQAFVDCDGEDRPTVVVATAGSLDVAAPLTVGGGGAAELSHVALFRAKAGALGDVTSWPALSQQRFAQLAGVYPTIAGGKRVPNGGLRDGEANVDLQLAPDAPRRLFLVGTQWPRVACRPDPRGARFCGYLAEPARSRVVPAAASAWQADGLTVTAGATPFVDGELRFGALAAAGVNGTHTLSTTATAGPSQVLSFYVHSLGAARVGVSAGGLGAAVFDVQAGRVVSQAAGATAEIEAWGSGVFRCAYRFKSAGGPTTYTVQMLDDGGASTFAGTGAPTLEVAGLQVDVGVAHAGTLLATPIQSADQLTFDGKGGNLPAGGPVLSTVDVMLPAGPFSHDQAIFNLNYMGTFADQVQLYVRGDDSRVKFWALHAEAQMQMTYWAFTNESADVANGVRHTLAAGWDTSRASLSVDRGAPLYTPVQGTPTQTLDEIDVGFSEMSSGAFEGLIAGFSVGAP